MAREHAKIGLNTLVEIFQYLIFSLIKILSEVTGESLFVHQLIDDGVQVRQLNSGQVQGYLSILKLRRADLNRLALHVLKRIHLVLKRKVILLDFLFYLD